MALKQLITFVMVVGFVRSLVLKNGAYDDLVIKVSETVPENDCANIIDNLQQTLTSASQYLFSALDSRAFLRSATVLLPPHWPDACVPSAVLSATGEQSDITILPKDTARGKLWTQQSFGCGEEGDQIFIGYEALLKRDNVLARTLIKEFAKYRYGVFEEQGYYNDPVYPMCYYDDQAKKGKITGCSDLPIADNGICTGQPNAVYNTSQMVSENARSSIMFAPEAASVSMFCDEGNHDRFASTKHNLMCQRRSVLDVVLNHADFLNAHSVQNNLNSNQITDTTPKLLFKRQNLTRYVFVIENTKDMMLRESWNYLRLAMRQWAQYVLPSNSEVGIVLDDSARPLRVLDIVSINTGANDRFGNRDKFYSALPYIPNENMQRTCLHCAIKEAMQMLNDRNGVNGQASNVIVVIAPGMDETPDLGKIVEEVSKSKIKIATINYPNIVRKQTLKLLADKTGGADYTVFEQKLNVDTTLLTTYFELHNVLYNIVQRFYSGSETDLPVEIHRREINNDGRSSVTGSFMLDPNMGEPAQLTFFTHNTITPLIKNVTLISPSHQVYSNRNDKFIDFKMITLNANISETGTWTYTVEQYTGNPQPHFLQVMATPKSPLVPVIRADFRVHRKSAADPIVLLVNVKYGDSPILGAKVEVTAMKHEYNGSQPQRIRFELLDTGAGDPDITKGDGVYTRYFSAAEWGPGLYTFEVVVSDNGNTAYTWSRNSLENDEKPCCGKSISSSGVQPISPFHRYPPKITLFITSEEIVQSSETSIGRIGDLRVNIIPEDMKARLLWTSPDMGGNTVSRYEVKYARNALDIMEKFETDAILWDHPQPLPLQAGSDTTLTLDMSLNKELLDKPLFFAVKAYQKMGDQSGPISNWVRVLVPAPPPPPTVPPTSTHNDASYWPNNGNSLGNEENGVGPSVAQPITVQLEWLLPVIIGIIILIVILIVYCYFCVVKRRDQRSRKKKSSKETDKLNSNITIVPSSPQIQQQQTYNYESELPLPDPHQIGVPVSNYGYEDETKKRFSLVNQQEQQLIEELKQQQQYGHYGVTGGGLSVISARPGLTLSPYNSWSASQLLHEHERRHSPDQEMHIEQQGHMPPPVPPLPAFNGSPNGYPMNYSIYGVSTPQANVYQQQQPFNVSLQGSMSSVNSGDKKRRNVTMV